MPNLSPWAGTINTSSPCISWRRCSTSRAAPHVPCSKSPALQVAKLRSDLAGALDRIAKVEGAGGEVLLGNDLNKLLNVTDKLAQQRGDQFISSELFVLAASEDRGELGRLLKANGVARAAIGKGHRGGARRRQGGRCGCGGESPGA